MATFHLGETGVRRRRWAVWGAIAVAIGSALALIVMGSGPPPAAGPSMTASASAWPAAALRPAAPEDLSPSAVTPSSAGGMAPPDQRAAPNPVQLQAQARLYADCQDGEARRVQGVVSVLDESEAVDPSGALASAYRQVEQQRIEQCRQVGTAEYRQIEPLMQEAARRGEPNARLFLIEQQLRRLAERAAEARALGETDVTADASRTAQTQARLQELEQLALQGWLPAMKTLAGELLTSDPLRTAAWNLVAARPPGDDRPLTLQDLAASGTLTPLSAEDSAQVLSKAQQLRGALAARSGELAAGS